MSRQIFLVRIRRCFRILPIEEEGLVRYAQRVAHPFARAFTSRIAAKQFVETQMPVWQNPFALGYPSELHPGTGLLTFVTLDEEDVQYAYLPPVLGYMNSLGLPPIVLPEDYMILAAWWERHQDRLSDEQKAEIWRRLDIMPYEIAEVKADW